GILIERLVEHRFEDRLRIRREALIGIPRRNVVRPSDRRRVIGSRAADPRRPENRRARQRRFQEGPSLQLDRHGMLLEFAGHYTRSSPFRGEADEAGREPGPSRRSPGSRPGSLLQGEDLVLRSARSAHLEAPGSPPLRTKSRREPTFALTLPISGKSY